MFFYFSCSLQNSELLLEIFYSSACVRLQGNCCEFHHLLIFSAAQIQICGFVKASVSRGLFVGREDQFSNWMIHIFGATGVSPRPQRFLWGDFTLDSLSTAKRCNFASAGRRTSSLLISFFLYSESFLMLR